MTTEARRFDGKAVLVTGAAGGVGRATALSFAAAGAAVMATDVNEDGLAAVAAEAKGAGTEMATLVHDLIGRENCHAVVASAVDALGGLDVLANVAGTIHSKHVVDVTEADWNLTMSVNLGSPFFLSQAVTKSFAMEFVKSNIRINAIAPGGMQTGMVENYTLPDDIDFDLVMRYAGFRGMADPQTAANGILWLASDEAARCNGTILSIDGGLAAG